MTTPTGIHFRVHGRQNVKLYGLFLYGVARSEKHSCVPTRIFELSLQLMMLQRVAPGRKLSADASPRLSGHCGGESGGQSVAF